MKKLVSMFVAIFCMAASVCVTSCDSKSNDSAGDTKNENINKDSQQIQGGASASDGEVTSTESETDAIPAVVDFDNQAMVEGAFCAQDWMTLDGSATIDITYNNDGTGERNEYGEIINFTWQYDADPHKLTVKQGGKTTEYTVESISAEDIVLKSKGGAKEVLKAYPAD